MPPRHVLLVDDEPDILEVASVALAALKGWDVRTAGSGAAAVEAARAEPPDAIVLDVMMPGLDGPATLAELRRHPETAGVPVVFLTAKVQVVDRERLLADGALGVLAKPFDPVTLGDELAALLGWA